MRLTFQVSVELDPAWTFTELFKLTHSEESDSALMDQIQTKKRIECENALADALMHKDGIVAGSVTVIRQEP